MNKYQSWVIFPITNIVTDNVHEYVFANMKKLFKDDMHIIEINWRFTCGHNLHKTILWIIYVAIWIEQKLAPPCSNFLFLILNQQKLQNRVVCTSLYCFGFLGLNFPSLELLCCTYGLKMVGQIDRGS
jgi:hypothetical protein